VEASLQQYILNLVRATRQDEKSPQSSRYRGFTTSNSGSGFSLGRDYAIPDDVKISPHVLSHRLIPTGDAELRQLWSGSVRFHPKVFGVSLVLVLRVEMADTLSSKAKTPPTKPESIAGRFVLLMLLSLVMDGD